MDLISPNSPAYYLTSVAKDRLPVFRLDALKAIARSALDEARQSGSFLILAYVIMPDHLHVITDGENKPAVTHGFLMQVRFGLVDYKGRLYLSHYLDG